MQALIDHLQAQASALNGLVAVLDQELHLIGSRDAETLITLLKDKEALLDDIQQRDTTIQRWYEKVVADDAPVHTSITTLIDTCKGLVKQCQYRTEINQTAVVNGQLRLAHLKNIFNELRAKETMTYDRSGKTHSTTPRSPIKA